MAYRRLRRRQKRSIKRKKQKVKEDAPPYYKRLIIGKIRQIWQWSPQRRLALKAAWSDTENGYECADCKSFYEKQSVQVDHISPVVRLTGWISWDDYIERQMEGSLQVLCRGCHKTKTLCENAERKKNK